MIPKILIVEDDMMMRAIFGLYSEQCGFENIGAVESAEKALQMLETNSVDVVLLDIYLKGSTTGIELAKIIETKFDLPIIIITAKIDETLIENSMSKNIFGFLFKPLHKNNFKSTVYFALAKYKFNNQKYQTNV